MAFIETMEDFAQDVKEKVGDKGFYLLLAAGAGLAVFSYIKAVNGGGATTLVAPTTYEGYPDAAENANVIMDSVNKQIESSQDSIIMSLGAQIEYGTGSLKDSVAGLGTQLDSTKGELLGALDDHNSNVTEQITSVKDKMDENFEATNNYIQQGIDATTKLSEKVDDVAAKQQPVYVYKSSGSGGSSSSSSSSSSKKKTNTTQTTQTTAPATENKSNNTIKYTTKGGLDTEHSIVDALKAAGESSSFNDRANLYYANGGTGTYTGSSSQNVSMLNKLKEGTLQKSK